MTVMVLKLPVFFVILTVHHDVALLVAVIVAFDVILLDWLPPLFVNTSSDGKPLRVTPDWLMLIDCVRLPAVTFSVPLLVDEVVAPSAVIVIVLLPVPLDGVTVHQLTGMPLTDHSVFDVILTVVLDLSGEKSMLFFDIERVALACVTDTVWVRLPALTVMVAVRAELVVLL